MHEEDKGIRTVKRSLKNNMKNIGFEKVNVTEGFLKYAQDLNREKIIPAVYDRFYETKRVEAFDFNWKAGMDWQPHIFWDSDIAKWMESAAYILIKHPEDTGLREKVDILVDKIIEHQQEDGYFNIYFTICEPERRFKDRNCHELYCAGHLFEAAVAYTKATGCDRFLKAMDRYADCIYKTFVVDKSAAFLTPGHEEIELALVKMYRLTGKKKYLDLATYFIDTRGDKNDTGNCMQQQSHAKVRDQKEAVGHCVRAMYLYTAMADLAKENNDKELENVCRTLFKDVTERKMYVTGGIGSCFLGEVFSKPYDLPNQEAYTETCAGIGLMFFANRMMELENDSVYADVIERAFYNGVMSGVSISGEEFFYENPLEITMLDHFTSEGFGSKRYPITQRVKCFGCSCCPPNLTRLLASIGDYIYGKDGDTLYINQFAGSVLDDGQVKCEMKTDYPRTGCVKIKAEGVSKIAVRIPGWCDKFKTNAEYEMKNGYAVMDNKGEITVTFDMTPFTLRANTKVIRDAGRICVQRGPVVYCAEECDNGENLHSLIIPENICAGEEYDETYKMVRLEVQGYREVSKSEDLYVKNPENCFELEKVGVKLIPYRCFANRGEQDMLVWLRTEHFIGKE